FAILEDWQVREPVVSKLISLTWLNWVTIDVIHWFTGWSGKCQGDTFHTWFAVILNAVTVQVEPYVVTNRDRWSRYYRWFFWHEGRWIFAFNRLTRDNTRSSHSKGVGVSLPNQNLNRTGDGVFLTWSKSQIYKTINLF